MNKLRIPFLLPLLAFLALHIFIYSSEEHVTINKATLTKAEKKPWLFFTYIAADNNLEPASRYNLKQMVEGAQDNVHMVVYLSTHRSGEPKVTKQLLVTKNGITQDGPDLYNLDSGSEQTLIQGINWALDTFPADHVVVNLWDHGSGMLNRSRIIEESGTIELPEMHRGICYDDTTGNYLTDREVKRALEAATAKLGRKLDIFACDACLMADLEIAYTVKPYADILVASQQTIPDTGFDYTALSRIFSSATITPAALAKHIVLTYENYYKIKTQDYTLSAIDLNLLDPIVANNNKIAQMLIALLKQQRTAVTSILHMISTRQMLTRFQEPTYGDLVHFYINLRNATQRYAFLRAYQPLLAQTLTEGINTITKAVIANVRGPVFPNASGLSIYLPETRVDTSYPALYWSENNSWDQFLGAYLRR